VAHGHGFVPAPAGADPTVIAAADQVSSVSDGGAGHDRIDGIPG
jgi:hypothetical protein